MSAEELYVRTIYETAFASWHQGDGCKIYHKIGDTCVALSATFRTDAEAWQAAWQRMQERRRLVDALS